MFHNIEQVNIEYVSNQITLSYVYINVVKLS